MAFQQARGALQRLWRRYCEGYGFVVRAACAGSRRCQWWSSSSAVHGVSENSQISVKEISQGPKALEGSRDAVQSQSVGGFIPMRLCRAERLRRDDATRFGAVHPLGPAHRVPIRVGRPRHSFCVFWLVSQAFVDWKFLAGWSYALCCCLFGRLGVRTRSFWVQFSCHCYSWQSCCSARRDGNSAPVECVPYPRRAGGHASIHAHPDFRASPIDLDAHLQDILMRPVRVQCERDETILARGFEP
mmetsp:Transcript_18246/g.49299  ORF Transcript_18246/g.49299 Transcript_18246/m.49299 type:complete len:244 (+) Transcript_18246:386-1117(+)